MFNYSQGSTVMGNCSAVGGVPGSWGQAQRNGADLQRLMAMQQSAANQLGQAYQQQGLSQAPPDTPIKRPNPVVQSKPKGVSMFSEVASDVKSFLLEHRSTLYFIAIALILDHLLFKDAFRHRLQAMAEKMIAKVEAKV